MIKVLVNGAHGKMGRVTVEAIQAHLKLSLVAALGKEDNLAAALKNTQPDVAIDFTTPTAVYRNACTIIEHQVRPIIGTTGLTSSEIVSLSKLCDKDKLGGIIAPNFSLGAILMMKMAELAAPYFKDCEIIEIHHPQKKDKPSGTAIKTKELILEAQESNSVDIPIHSVRLPGHIAHQMVIFGGQSESLTLRHDTQDRSCFMPGVTLSCEKVMTLSKLVYGLESILSKKDDDIATSA